MKKVFVLIISALVLTTALSGCSRNLKDVSAPASPTAPVSAANLKNFSDFWDNFNKLLSVLPEFSIIPLLETDLDDGNTSCAFRIKYFVEGMYEGYEYSLHITKNSENKITWLDITADAKEHDVNIALLSSYAYESMDLPEIDAESFYDKFQLFGLPTSTITESCGDYEVNHLTVGEYNQFIICFND